MSFHPNEITAHYPSHKAISTRDFGSAGRRAERSILGAFHNMPVDMEGVFAELSSLRQHESGKAFKSDLRRINHDLRSMGLLPNMSIVDNRNGGFEVAPNAVGMREFNGTPHRRWGGHNSNSGYAQPHYHEHHGRRYGRQNRDSDWGSVADRGIPAHDGMDLPPAQYPNSDSSTRPNSSSQKQAMTDIVVREAQRQGLSQRATVAAVAAMLQESGGNPSKPGDHNNSIGLFQLNFAGGEGTAFQRQNGLSRAQAMHYALDPTTNARVALQYFKQHQHRTSDHGSLAKMAQRAGDPDYIHHVNRYVAEATRLVARSLQNGGQDAEVASR